jgi:hypothetical protein
MGRQGRPAASKPPVTKVELATEALSPPPILSSDEEALAAPPPSKAARVDDGIGGLPTPVASPAGVPAPNKASDCQTLSTKMEEHFAGMEQNFSANSRSSPTCSARN